MGTKEKHVSLSRLYEAIAGGRKAAEQGVDEHLVDCIHCRSDSEWMKGLLKFGGADAANEPPAGAVVNAMNAFRVRKPSAVRFATETIAQLIYDSFNEPLPAGVRQRELAARQTLYHAEGLQLDLKVQVTGEDTGIIIGQVVSETDDIAVDDLEIALSNKGELIGASNTNNWGEFVFEDLPRGNYELQVQFGEKVLRLPKVPLGIN